MKKVLLVSLSMLVILPSIRFVANPLYAQQLIKGVALMNFTDRETSYTRIIEHKHFEQFGEAVYGNPKTVITREYPLAYQPGQAEPYYPVNDDRNNRLYHEYQELADVEKNVLFGGRLAEYKYYNMDEVIERVFSVPLI